jgi:hypothetical protein
MKNENKETEVFRGSPDLTLFLSAPFAALKIDYRGQGYIGSGFD